MQEVYLSLTGVSDVSMAPNLGLAGGTALGSTSFNVITDSPAGYSVSVVASHSPAMQSSFGTIPNYVPAGLVPDFAFTSTASQAFFGFSPEGSDITIRYKDDGVACGIGTLDTSAACWDTLGTAEQIIASGNVSNHPSGATTTIQFRITLGSGAAVTAGLYTATTTITALPL